MVKDKITWERPIFESVVMTMQNVTDKPFKVAFLGPAQQSVIVKDEFYGDQVAVARDLAIAMNQELKYLVSIGLEAVQLIDVLPPYTTDMWQIEMQNILFDGVDAIKFWHVCYGSVDGQRDIFDNHAASMMPLFKESPADVIHLEFTNKGFDELEAFRDFPTDKVLGVGVVDAKNLQVETRRADRGRGSGARWRSCPPTGSWSRRTAGWATSAGPPPTPSSATWARRPPRCGARSDRTVRSTL